MGEKIISLTPIGFNPIHKGRAYIANNKIFTPIPADFIVDAEINPNRWQIEYEAKASNVVKEAIEADINQEKDLVAKEIENPRKPKVTKRGRKPKI